MFLVWFHLGSSVHFVISLPKALVIYATYVLSLIFALIALNLNFSKALVSLCNDADCKLTDFCVHLALAVVKQTKQQVSSYILV